MRWKAWYSDGRSFSDQDGSPTEMPGRDVQIIAQEDPFVGRTIHTRDFYIWREDWKQWVGTDLPGAIDMLESMGLLKIGRLMPSKAFHDLTIKATDDPYLPVKSGIRDGE